AGLFADCDQRGAVFVRAAGVDLAAEVMRDELHAVADAQHGNTGLQRLRVDLRRALFVNAGGTSAEDQSAGIALLQLGPWCRAGQGLELDFRSSHPPRYRLAELQ